MRLARAGFALLTVPAVFGGLLLLGAGAYLWRRATRPYRRLEVSFESEGVQLSGTLLLPLSPGPHPGVVLVHGMFLGLRHFYNFYADFFARLGLAVLFYDKRGTGHSRGRPSLLALEQQARDAAAAWQALCRHPQVDPARVGFWGYSLGGAATLRAAELVEQPAFVIGLSQPAMPLGEILTYYSCGMLAGALGRQARALRRALWNFSRSGRGWRRLYHRLKDAQSQVWYRAARLPRVLDEPSPQNSPGALRRGLAPLPFRWDNEDLDFDPLPILARLDCPLLLIYGDRDFVVPSNEFVRRVEAFRSAHYLPQLSIASYPGGDHAIHRPGLPFNLGPCFCGTYLSDMQHWLTIVLSLQRPAPRRLRSEISGAALSRY